MQATKATKFKASFWPDEAPIEEVPILRETPTMVFLPTIGHREVKQLKRSHHVSFFDTFEEARQHHIEIRTQQMLQAEQELAKARAALEEAKNFGAPPRFAPMRVAIGRMGTGNALAIH